MQRYLGKIAAVGFLLFLGFWIAGSIHGMTLPFPPPPPLIIASGMDRESYSKDNSQQTANNLRQLGLIEKPLPFVLDNPEVEKIQVHEKRAFLGSGSSAFNADEALVRSAIQDYQGTIFNEKNTGLAPARRLTLEIGVSPDKFDALVERLKSIGNLSSISIEQKDRTGEFRKLFAQRQSLKKYHEAILKLRGVNNPSIDDSLKLEQKIQDIEKELQALSVQFGDLLGKESFYHVHVTLVEYQPGDRLDRTYTIPQRIGHAFLWAVAWWSGVAVACCVLTATAISILALWPGAKPRTSPG